MEISFCSFTFMHLLSSFLLFHLAIAHFTSSTRPLCHDHDRSALLNFKESLNIDQTASGDPFAYPKVASWNLDEGNSDCCSWNGVKCNEDSGHVVELDLASSFLYGSINSTSSLFHLVHLEKLDLSDNDFKHSEIPSEIINLSRLTHLNLSFSVFSGQIPAELLELSRLKVLDLSSDGHTLLKLQKPGLANLAEKLTNLKILDLMNVNISSAVPPTLANLSSLISLSLSESFLQGEFPAEIFLLTRLQLLDVMNNPNLTGSLPEFHIGCLLSEFRLSSTRFSGKIPDSIKNLESLSYLDICDSSFSGKIPPSLGNLSNIKYLCLSGNEFSGGLPTSFANLVSLKTLEIYSFHFSGKFPALLGNLTQLSSLAISGCNFSSSISLSWLANLNQLTSLHFSENNLTGEIPSVLLNLTQLNRLSLRANQLSGPIPYWLMNLNKLSILLLYSNKLSGPIPVEVGNLTQLQVLVISSNQLEGSVPSSIFDLWNLEELDLSFNNLSGTVDLNKFLLNLKSLEVFVLSSNKLSLLTATTVNTYLQKFSVIGLRSCNLSEFPSFLHNQTELISLDLSSNKIAGQVPAWLLCPYGYDYLNLSHNLLTGFERGFVVPSGAYMGTLDFRFNKLQGSLPILSMPAYIYLVSNNQLTGEVPPLICSLNDLYVLDLSYNNLSGILPKCLGSFNVKLLVLKLQGNNFHGSIPQICRNGTNVRMVDFSNNSLQGNVPKSLANCVELKFLNLGHNQITDIFPYWLGILPKLEVLILKFNNFHGIIKEAKISFEFTKLRIIDLSHNRFTGSLPSKYFEGWDAIKDINAELTVAEATRLSNSKITATLL